MARRGLSANVLVTGAIVVIAALVIGGVLLVNRSEGTTSEPEEIPRELRAGPEDNTLTEAADGRVTVVEFLDYQCPACAMYYQQVTRKVEADYADRITFVTRNFPLDSHPLAEQAALAAEAAAAQGGYRDMYHALYDGYAQWAVTEDGSQVSDDAGRAAARFDAYATELGLDLERFRADLGSAEVRERVAADLAAGRKVGVTGTPTIFVNGERFSPSGDRFTDVDRELRDLIDEELR